MKIIHSNLSVNDLDRCKHKYLSLPINFLDDY